MHRDDEKMTSSIILNYLSSRWFYHTSNSYRSQQDTLLDLLHVRSQWGRRGRGRREATIAHTKHWACSWFKRGSTVHLTHTGVNGDTPCMMWLDKRLKYSIWAGSILYIFQPTTHSMLCVYNGCLPSSLSSSFPTGYVHAVSLVRYLAYVALQETVGRTESFTKPRQWGHTATI